MKLCIDLFAGTGSATAAFRDEGYEDGWVVETLDIDPSFHPTYLMDIDRLERLPKAYDFGWASPDCSCYSVASIGTHWTGGDGAYVPKTEKARASIRTVFHTIDLLGDIPTAAIENPVSVFRKVWGPILAAFGYVRKTVWLCQYGDSRAKPTDIFVKGFEFEAKTCHNGNPDHEEARRGAKTGTQGRKGPMRSILPFALSETIYQGVTRTCG